MAGVLLWGSINYLILCFTTDFDPGFLENEDLFIQLQGTYPKSKQLPQFCVKLS